MGQYERVHKYDQRQEYRSPTMHSTLPLARYRALQTQDPAAAMRQAVMFSPHQALQPMPGGQDFKLTINSISLEQIRLSAVASTGHRISVNDDENLAILIPLKGSIEIEDEQQRSRAAPGQLLLTRAAERRTLVASGYRGLVIQARRGFVLDDPVGATEAIPSVTCWQTARFSCRQGPAVQLFDYLNFVFCELDRSANVPSGAALRTATNMLMKELIFDILAAAEHGATVGVEAASWQVRRAEAFMRAFYNEALSIADIAAAGGISVRALQLGFRRHLGISPRGYLENYRLQRIRHKFLTATAGQTVTTIAVESGITHLGRFAERYRRAHGELPSQTLGRSRPVLQRG